MKYNFNMGIWNSVFAVPTALTDKHIKLASKEQLKTILWVLRHGGEEFSVEQLGEALNITVESAEDSIEYWINNRFISQNESELLPGEKAIAAPAVTTTAQILDMPIVQAEIKLEEKKSPPVKKRMLRPDSQHIVRRMGESDEIRYLMQETQGILGKTLSPALSQTLITIHDDYGLPVEIIMMIIHYAKSVEKTSTTYIESVAKDWAHNDIFTIDAADAKLKELDEKKICWKKVESCAGLTHRAPTANEETAAYRWVSEWRMTNEMLIGAYERCAENIGKFNVKYINTILDKWHKSGFKNMNEVIASEEFGKNATGKKNKSYDIEEYEEQSFFAPPPEN